MGNFWKKKNPKNATGIGYMFQKDHLFEWRDIFSNVSLGLEIQKKLNTETKQELLTCSLTMDLPV